MVTPIPTSIEARRWAMRRLLSRTCMVVDESIATAPWAVRIDSLKSCVSTKLVLIRGTLTKSRWSSSASVCSCAPPTFAYALGLSMF